MAREILVAELATLNFESFVNTEDGLQAYVQEEVFNEDAKTKIKFQGLVKSTNPPLLFQKI